MDLIEAKAVCKEIAALRKRWGRHADNGPYTDDTVRNALVAVHDAGLFDNDQKHLDVVAANRAKGAAEARASKYKKDLDELKEKVEELTAELKKCKENSNNPASKRKLFG